MYNNLLYPKILFFSSNHCAPCKPIEVMLNRINISLFGKRLNVKRIDIEESTNREIIQKYRITALPTLIIGTANDNKRLSVNIQEEEIIDAILYGFISSVKI